MNGQAPGANGDPHKEHGQGPDAAQDPSPDTPSVSFSRFEFDEADGMLRLLRVLQARNDRLTLEVEQWRERFDSQEARIAQLHDELELVFRTRSWRLTAPLRGAQESLAKSNSVVKLQAMTFARRYLPRGLKNM